MFLQFETASCIGCRLCQLACSGYHEGEFNPKKAKLSISSTYTQQGLAVRASYCTQCLKCLEVCPEGAIRLQNGYLKVDTNVCSGCLICKEVCPEGVIVDRGATVGICDLCDGSPVCVEWCPHQALKAALEEKVVS